MHPSAKIIYELKIELSCMKADTDGARWQLWAQKANTTDGMFHSWIWLAAAQVLTADLSLFNQKRETVNFAVQVTWPQDKVNCSWDSPSLITRRVWMTRGDVLFTLTEVIPTLYVYSFIHRWQLLQYTLFQSAFNELWSLHGSLTQMPTQVVYISRVFNSSWFLKDCRITLGFLCYSSTIALVTARKDRCINWRLLQTFALSTITQLYADI